MTLKASAPHLSPDDLGQGAVILWLIESWSDWVHRRVEHVTLADPEVSERRISLDFTLAPGDPIPALAQHGEEGVYLVPVTWMTKRRVTRFSLRDERDASLPVWTQTQTGVIATAVLAEAATDRLEPPKSVTRSIRQPRLPTVPTIPADLLNDLWFIAYAKESEALSRWEGLAGTPENLVDEEAQESARWRAAITRNGDFMALANDFARNYLILTAVRGMALSRRVLKLSFEEQRLDTPLRPRSAQLDRQTDDGWRHALRVLRRQLERFLGLRAKRVELPAASVGRAQCYHVEVDVPEGIRLTRARLVAYPARESLGAQTGGDEEREDIVTRSAQCVHLHLADVPRAFSGAGVLLLRIGDGLIVRGAWLNSLFTTTLLILLASFPKAFVSDPGAAVAVLLGIPGGISLYLARAREPGMSTSMHAGVRMLALGNAAAAFGAVAVVMAGGDCGHNPKTALEVCTHWSGTNPSLIVLATLAGAMLFSLSLALLFSRRPPELQLSPPAST